MAQVWYYEHDGQQQGPVISQQLKQLASSGDLQPTDLVWKEGAKRRPAKSFKGLFQTTSQPKVTHPPIPTSVVSTDQPGLIKRAAAKFSGLKTPQKVLVSVIGGMSVFFFLCMGLCGLSGGFSGIRQVARDSERRNTKRVTASVFSQMGRQMSSADNYEEILEAINKRDAEALDVLLRGIDGYSLFSLEEIRLINNNPHYARDESIMRSTPSQAGIVCYYQDFKDGDGNYDGIGEFYKSYKDDSGNFLWINYKTISFISDSTYAFNEDMMSSASNEHPKYIKAIGHLVFRSLREGAAPVEHNSTDRRDEIITYINIEGDWIYRNISVSFGQPNDWSATHRAIDPETKVPAIVFCQTGHTDSTVPRRIYKIYFQQPIGQNKKWNHDYPKNEIIYPIDNGHKWPEGSWMNDEE